MPLGSRKYIFKIHWGKKKELKALQNSIMAERYMMNKVHLGDCTLNSEYPFLTRERGGS